LNRIDGTAEFRQHAIPGCVGDPAAMGGNKAVHGRSPLGQLPEGPDLIGAHESAIPGDVCRKDSRKPPFYPLAGQEALKNEFFTWKITTRG
jgi:hypothetical protein